MYTYNYISINIYLPQTSMAQSRHPPDNKSNTIHHYYGINYVNYLNTGFPGHDVRY